MSLKIRPAHLPLDTVMLKLYFILFLIMTGGTGCRTQKSVTAIHSGLTAALAGEQATDFSEQQTWLLGYFSRERMTLPPHSEWYSGEYEKYRTGTKALGSLATISKDDLAVIVVLGTWCPDSQREVPRFMKIIDLWNFPPGNITFIGVDNEKIAPVGDYDKLDIDRVPTFIFYKKNIEEGRIIENPVTSLEQDMVEILKGNE